MAREPARRPNDSRAPVATGTPAPNRANRLRRIFRPLRSADINPAIHGPGRRFLAFLGSLWDMGAYVYLIFVVIGAASRKLSGDVPTFLQPVHAVFPYLVAPTVVTLLVSIVRRRAILVLLSAGLAAMGWFAVAPARRTLVPPAWLQAQQKPQEVSIAVSNMYFENVDQIEAARALLARDADIVVLTELTDSQLRILEDQGSSSKYPYRSAVTTSGPAGGAIFSKFALKETRRWGADKLPEVDAELPNKQLLRVLSIHPFPPLDERQSKIWNRDLDRLKARAPGERGIPFVAAGDFNGTRWQPRYGALLTELRDAHEAVGKGLTMSWPKNRGMPAFARLDHALFNDRVFPLSVENFNVPGSDHQGFEVRFAIQPEPVAAVEEGDEDADDKAESSDPTPS